MTAPVRLAVAGAGLIGRRHIAAIRQSEGAELAAVVDPTDGAQDVAASEGVAWFPDLAEMPEGQCNGVLLATPNAVHVEGGLACVARRLPVLVEKPFAVSVTEGLALVKAADSAGVPLLTGHHRRHNPLIVAAKRLIEEGVLGRPVSAHGMFWLAKPDDYFDVPWRREPGAGPILTNLIHDIDLMRFLLGDVVWVQAVLTNAVRGHAVEDACSVVMEFASGLLATMSAADCVPAPWSWEFSSGENPAYPPAGAACYMIGGTEASLELPSLRLWRHEGKRSWWSPLSATVPPRPQGDPLVLQVEQFARVIRGEEAPLVSGREGLNTLAVIEAIRQAALENRRVSVAVH